MENYFLYFLKLFLSGLEMFLFFYNIKCDKKSKPQQFCKWTNNFFEPFKTTN